MKKPLLSATLAALAVLVLATVAVAADRTRGRDMVRDRDEVATLLGLNHDQLMDLRHEGLSLAQIAERQAVDPQALISALQARWEERIAARVENGALTDAEAAELREQLEVRARDMVYRTVLGGMHGAAVGAGPQHAAGQGGGGSQGAGQAGGGGQGLGAGPGQGMRGAGAGSGTCDGTGPHGPGQP